MACSLCLADTAERYLAHEALNDAVEADALVVQRLPRGLAHALFARAKAPEILSCQINDMSTNMHRCNSSKAISINMSRKRKTYIKRSKKKSIDLEKERR